VSAATASAATSARTAGMAGTPGRQSPADDGGDFRDSLTAAAATASRPAPVAKPAAVSGSAHARVTPATPARVAGPAAKTAKTAPNAKPAPTGGPVQAGGPAPVATVASDAAAPAAASATKATADAASAAAGQVTAASATTTSSPPTTATSAPGVAADAAGATRPPGAAGHGEVAGPAGAPTATLPHGPPPPLAGDATDNRQGPPTPKDPSGNTLATAAVIAASGAPVVDAPAARGPATPVSAPPTPSSPPPPSPAAQLVSVIAPLQSSDGSHQVSLSLRPEGLGTVQATVTVSPDRVVIQLTAESSSARQALEQALPLLRHQFTADGTNATVVLSGGSGPGDTSPDHRQFGDPRSSSSSTTQVDVALERAVQSLVPTTNRLIDVQL
jgi:flagellar hook-length control protein FliK